MSSDTFAHQAAIYEPPPDLGLQAVYQDDHMVVVNKPSGLLTVPGRGEHLQDCLIHRVQGLLPSAMIVHRLDMATSGLVVLALGPEMQRELSKLFMNRQVHKCYEAVASGLVAQDEGSIDAPLITDWPQRPRQKVDHELGKPSLTHYQVLARDAQAQRTRLLLKPVTGRSHQLRVHLLSLGHPIIGDPLYGPDELRAHEPRLLLHATELLMPHPVSHEDLRLSSACPF